VSTEQRCGRLDASGRFVVASADASLEQVCSQESLKPVAVAYRSVAVQELKMPEIPPKVVQAPPTMTPKVAAASTSDKECHWGEITSVHTSMSSMTLNGQMMDVRGVEQQAWVTTELQRCGHLEAAEAFNAWRGSRRTTNIACATIVGCYPFGVGIWSAVKAKQHRLQMEQLLLAGSRPATGD